MAKIEKEVLKYVKPYLTNSGSRWQVIIPDGSGGQIRQQGFIEKSLAISFAVREFQKVLLNDKGMRSIGSLKAYFSRVLGNLARLKDS